MNNEGINFIIAQLTTLATAAVNAIKGNEFRVKVTNPTKVQDIKGTVIVGNQKNLEAEIKRANQSTTKSLLELKTALKPIQPKEFPKEIKVTNPSEFPKAVFKVPDNFKVNNFKEVSTELTKLGKLLKDSIDSIKLDPKINVAAPNIEVKPTPVIVNEKEFDIESPIKQQTSNLQRALTELGKLLRSDDPTQYLPVRLTDGKEFYEAIRSIVAASGRAIFKDAGGGAQTGLVDDQRRVVVWQDNADPTDPFQISDKDDATDPKYYGFVKADGSWYILKSNGDSYRYAVGDTDYPTNWTGKAGLSYDYFNNVWN